MSKIDTFTHLHLHSGYGSFLDGVSKPADYCNKAANIGQKAVGVTEHGSCASHYSFHQAGKATDTHIIYGNEFYYTRDRHERGLTDKEKEGKTPTEIKEETKNRMRKAHLLLLAETDEGLQNIYRLNYLANTEGFYAKPCIDLDLLRQYNKGIIATTTCVISPMAKALQRHDIDGMTEWFEAMLGIFGKDRLYVELHPHDIDIQREYNQVLIEMYRKKYDIKTTLANDVHYAEAEQHSTHNFLYRLNTSFDEAGIDKLHFATEEEMIQKWYDAGMGDIISDEYLYEGIQSTAEIASRCHAQLDTETLKEPQFETPNGYKNNKDYMLTLLQKGMAAKVRKNLISEDEVPQYIERLKLEIELIADKGYIDYFLITNDFTEWAHENDILMSPGRGSASGSLICWLLGITHLNPIKYDLFFERFMNPERIKEPDIDNDFQDSRRADVKSYVASKWGDANIASVCAYSRYSVNTLFRDLAKDKGIDFKLSNKIAKTISGHISLNKELTTFTDLINSNGEVRSFISSLDPEEAKDFITTIDTLIGNVRNQTIAGGGVIISSQPLYDVMPLRKSKDGDLVTEWQIDELAKMKFLKIDMLGLSTLSVIMEVMKKVGMSIDDLYVMPIDRESLDEEEQKHYDKAYELLCEGDTYGVFQFGGANITRCLQKMVPRNVEDIAAVNAIYRPGVIKLGATEAFLRRRNGQEESKNDHHALFDDVLAPTENIMIYQEQFIQMFNLLGLNFGQGDILRKLAESMDHKKCNDYLEEHLYPYPEKMLLPLEDTKAVAKKLIDNAGYLFNKSHAISYSILAYWTSYFKAKYPAEFTEVMLNSHTGQHEEIALGLTMGRKLLDNPAVTLGNINDFSKDFSVTKDSIKIGLKNIKGLGDSVLNKMAKGSPGPGGWLDFTEFYKDNIELKMISHNALKVLIQLGLFDGLQFCGKEFSRRALCETIDVYNQLLIQTKKNFKKLMGSLFDDEDLEYENLFSSEYLPRLMDSFNINYDEEYTERELIDFELEYVGFRVTENMERIQRMTQVVNKLELQHISLYDEEEENAPHFWTKISTVEMLKTKKGKPYANVRAEDGSSFRIWHNKLQYCEDELVPGKIIAVKLTSDNFGRSLAWDRNSLLTEDNLLRLQEELY
jgi:DNA polymerase-3 subunit alpha